MKYKTFFYLFVGLSLLLLVWNLYMFSNVSGLQEQLDKAIEESEATEELYNTAGYDLETYKDSVANLKQQIENLKSKEMLTNIE